MEELTQEEKPEELPQEEKLKVKFTRKSLSLKEKLDIIDKIERGEKSQRDISNERDISRSTISTIWATREKIKSANSIQGRQDGCKRLRQPLFEEVDQALYRWCLYAREKNEHLSLPVLMEKAKKFATSLGIENFKCTTSWLDRFKMRHGIRCKRPPAENKETDHADDEEGGKHSWFITDLPNLLEHVSSTDVYAVNEVGLFHQVLPQECHIMGEFSNIGHSHRVTLLLGSNMDGSDRLPPLVIGNSTALSNHLTSDALSVNYCQDSQSWMTAQIWSDWIHFFDQRMHSMRRRVLLFIDACPSHFVVGNLKSVRVHFVPTSCKHFMPVKQGLMQRFKAWYRKLVLRDMVDSMNDGIEFQIDILSALHYVRKAWEHISQDCIITAFRLAGWNHEDYQHVDCVSQPVPTVSQECYKLNISESIFDHINQEEERMVTREELTDKLIVDSVTAQTNLSNYIDNDADESTHGASTTGNASVTNNGNVIQMSTIADDHVDQAKDEAPGVSEAKAAIETLTSFIEAVETERNIEQEKKAKSRQKRSLRKKAKIMSLCPEKGVFEIKEMKVDVDVD